MSRNVRGIDRFFPTQRSQVLFWATPAVVLVIFWQSPKLIELFMPSELRVNASQNKHGTTHHYINHAPEMNAKWLFINSRARLISNFNIFCWCLFGTLPITSCLSGTAKVWLGFALCINKELQIVLSVTCF